MQAEEQVREALEREREEQELRREEVRQLQQHHVYIAAWVWQSHLPGAFSCISLDSVS